MGVVPPAFCEVNTTRHGTPLGRLRRLGVYNPLRPDINTLAIIIATLNSM